MTSSIIASIITIISIIIISIMITTVRIIIINRTMIIIIIINRTIGRNALIANCNDRTPVHMQRHFDVAAINSR